MKSKRYLLALLACAGAACSGAEARPLSGRGGDARELALHPLARLNDGSQGFLARPERVSFAADGRMIVPDVSDKNVKLYDTGGLRVQTIGRVGHGPGEFVALLTAQAYRDSVVGYDMNGARLSVFGPDGRYVRAITFGDGKLPLPYSVRVVDDSLFLLVGAITANAGRDLLTLVRPDGTVISSFFRPTSYLGNDPSLLHHTGLIADAADGVVFAALVGGDSVYAFDYQGRRVSAQGIDPVQPLVTTKTLMARNGGRDRTAAGRWVGHGNRNVVRLVAMDSASVAMQVTTYDAENGTDPLDGGTFLVATVSEPGTIRTMLRQEIEGGLAGRDRQGNPLLLRYTSSEADAYDVVRVELRTPGAGGAQ